MRFLWIALVLVLPLVWTNPIPLADLEEAIDVLLTTVEAHERKIKTLQDEMYNVGDVLEKQAFLLRQLEEVVEDKKDPGKVWSVTSGHFVTSIVTIHGLNIVIQLGG